MKTPFDLWQMLYIPNFFPLYDEKERRVQVILEREIRSTDVEVQQVWWLCSVHIDDDYSERSTLLCAVCSVIKRFLLPFDISQSLVSRGAALSFETFRNCVLSEVKTAG